MSEEQIGQSGDGTEREAFAVEYFDAGGREMRDLFRPIPGSAHWNVITQERTDGEWETLAASELRTKPTINRSVDTETARAGGSDE